MSQVACGGPAPLDKLSVPVKYGVDRALKAGNDYGIQYYNELEFDDDGSVEIEGMTTIEEISIKKDGYIEVEGEDSNGRDIELKGHKPVSNKS